MPKFFVSSNQIKNDKIKIIGQDVKHIKTVLRAKIGDEIDICDLQNRKNFLCRIEEINKESIICKIQEETAKQAESNIQITVFQGLPKFDKMEFIIQKSVELGAFEIVSVEMKRCVVKLDEKDKIKKVERWQKISEVAAKQCGRDIIPEVKKIINLKNLCNLIEKYDIVFVAYENEKKDTLKSEIDNLKQMYKKIIINNVNKFESESGKEKDKDSIQNLNIYNKQNDKKIENVIKIGIVIGPEGGLEETEVELLKGSGAKIVTLGNRILRTETAPLYMLSIIMYELEQ